MEKSHIVVAIQPKKEFLESEYILNHYFEMNVPMKTGGSYV